MKRLIFSVVALLTMGFGMAMAATPTPHQQSQATPSAGSGFLSMLPMLIIIVLVFYFMVIRPQSKRAKEQKALMEGLKVGEEVITTAGIVGKIDKMRDTYVDLTISKDVTIKIQRSAIATVLPRGSADSME